MRKIDASEKEKRRRCLYRADSGGGNEADEAGTVLSGTVFTDGSTSMENVIGGLGEMFMETNTSVTFTYNPTGFGFGTCSVLRTDQAFSFATVMVRIP